MHSVRESFLLKSSFNCREDLFSGQTDTTSSSPLVQTIGNNDPVTYTVSVATVFLGNNTGGQDNITFVTEGNVDKCGIDLNIREEYILALSPALVKAYKGELTVNVCGLARKWSEVSEEDEGYLYADLCDDDQARGNVGSMLFARVLVSFRLDGFVLCIDLHMLLRKSF